MEEAAGHLPVLSGCCPLSRVRSTCVPAGLEAEIVQAPRYCLPERLPLTLAQVQSNRFASEVTAFESFLLCGVCGVVAVQKVAGGGCLHCAASVEVRETSGKVVERKDSFDGLVLRENDHVVSERTEKEEQSKCFSYLNDLCHVIFVGS